MKRSEQETDNILLKNEKDANEISAKFLTLILCILVPICFLIYFDILGEKSNNLLSVLIASIIVMSISVFLILVLKIEKWWIKYLLVSKIVILNGFLSVNSAAAVTVVWLIGVIFSSMYFSKPLTWYSFILLMIVQTISGITGVKLYPQFFGDIWYMQVFTLGIQVLIVFPLLYSLSDFTENKLNKLIISENEQKSILKKLMPIVKKSSEVSQLLAKEIRSFLEITDKSTKSNETITSNIVEMVDKSENNSKHITSASKSINSITESLSDNAREFFKISDLSKKVWTINNSVKKSVNTAVVEMSHINDNRKISKELISKLCQSALEVDRIIKIITAIANDTKLLALNAEVESAKCGEQGKGFSVVAVEVGKLAELNKKAVIDIASLVNNVQLYSQKLMETMNIGSTMVERGISSFNTLNAMFESFSEVINERDKEINSISNECREMVSVSVKISNIIEKIEEVNAKGFKSFQNVAASSEDQLSSMHQMLLMIRNWENLHEELLDLSKNV
ncbi:UNVERIFIED_CONTAM: Methyl-accepting chemotaxis protein [Acetivibrio alkalicellulosi]